MGYLEKVKLVASVMKGLVSLNEVKIMHRNLHPDNILICKQDGTDPVYKICGFMDAFDFSRRKPQRGEKPMSTVTDIQMSLNFQLLRSEPAKPMMRKWMSGALQLCFHGFFSAKSNEQSSGTKVKNNPSTKQFCTVPRKLRHGW